MREIRFRVWMPYNEDPSDMRMEYDPQLFAEDGNGIFTINNVFANPVEYFADNGTYPDAVIRFMQYTGLHDKNGREIYESDIVRTVDGKVQRVEFVAGYVDGKDDSGIAQFRTVSPDGMSYYIARTDEVIGNIYENPELLEVAEHE